MNRRFYPDSIVTVDALGDVEAFTCDDAEVWMEDDVILVSYFDQDGIVVLEGVIDSEPSGSAETSGAPICTTYSLTARSRPRRATLREVTPEAGAPNADRASRMDAREYRGRIEEQGESASWSLRLGALDTGAHEG